MLLIICHAGVSRYAIPSRHVSAVLPRANLHRLSGSPDWFAGMLIYRGTAIPVADLVQWTDGRPCANRLSSRMVVIESRLGGALRRFAILAEEVGLREAAQEPEALPKESAGSSPLGTLHLDEQGLFQILDLERLISDDRRAVLFPAEKEG